MTPNHSILEQIPANWNSIGHSFKTTTQQKLCTEIFEE